MMKYILLGWVLFHSVVTLEVMRTVYKTNPKLYNVQTWGQAVYMFSALFITGIYLYPREFIKSIIHLWKQSNKSSNDV